jgi:hypothetical protein
MTSWTEKLDALREAIAAECEARNRSRISARSQGTAQREAAMKTLSRREETDAEAT